MSDMIRARELMTAGQAKVSEADLLVSRAQELMEEAMGLFEQAHELTFRQSPVRRSPVEYTEITSEMREQIFDLACHRDMTMHEIADAVGLRNGGRVSEILNGKR